MFQDPMVEEIRAARENHARKFHYNLKLIVEDLRKRQQQAGRKTVSFPPKLGRKQKVDKQEVRTSCTHGII
ncbi:MAG: hypothetical protein C4527_20000 [Candidatus Omnitrophota bacterium]|jgi:hypothetical protein|nr:MAG: hypothetical protein C4527_20000 [Candidatus Omnitrophota bacterium]